jgi:hypothetical protein
MAELINFPPLEFQQPPSRRPPMPRQEHASIADKITKWFTVYTFYSHANQIGEPLELQLLLSSTCNSLDLRILRCK